MQLTREKILTHLLKLFEENFEIEQPGLDDDLREEHEFDSIDAIEVLVEVEQLLGVKLSQEEKKQAMDIRTINGICDWVEGLPAART
jgi:acyl carrier protein